MGMRARKVSVIPSTRESCGYGSKKMSVIPTVRESCGYESKKISMIPTTDIYEKKGEKKCFKIIM